MTPSHIRGKTRDFGKPADWDERVDGPCDTLAIRDEIDVLTGLPFMYSLWYPTPEELHILNSGGGIKLGISGQVHPVVNMEAVL